MLPALAEHREVVGSLVTDIMFGLLAACSWDAGATRGGVRRAENGSYVSQGVYRVYAPGAQEDVHSRSAGGSRAPFARMLERC